jgi:hypothetical protein
MTVSEYDKYLIAVNRAIDTGSEVGSLVVREPLLRDVVGVDVGGTCINILSSHKPNINVSSSGGKHTEVDVGLASVSAANPRSSGNRAALLEGDELVKVVEVGEHLKNKVSIDYSVKKQQDAIHDHDENDLPSKRILLAPSFFFYGG